jgi:hypothetical protein
MTDRGWRSLKERRVRGKTQKGFARWVNGRATRQNLAPNSGDEARRQTSLCIFAGEGKPGGAR